MQIFDIDRGSFVDGPGIRTTVFLQGCNLKCAWCHNPESQTHKKKILYYANLCVKCNTCGSVCENNAISNGVIDELKCKKCGRCELFCPQSALKLCGTEKNAEEIFDEIIKEKQYYETSKGGITFSGGECMLFVDELLPLLVKCKEEKISVAIDTAGNVPFGSFEKIFDYVDLFLYDIKIFDSAKHKKWTDVDNKLILENLKKILNLKKRVWIRIPVITGVNDSEEEMQQIKAFLLKEGYPEKIELLPYHAMGEGKYVAMGIEPQKFEVPSEKTMERLKAIFIR